MIYCFDLDKTICYSSRFYDSAKPIKKRIKKINSLYDNGDYIIIETARGSVSGINYEDITKKQLQEWGLKYHQLRVGVKIYADYYIDDKAVNAKDFF